MFRQNERNGFVANITRFVIIYGFSRIADSPAFVYRPTESKTAAAAAIARVDEKNSETDRRVRNLVTPSRYGPLVSERKYKITINIK